MQIESFKDSFTNKLKSKDKPVFQKALILFQTLDANLTQEQRQAERTAIFISLIQILNLQSNLDAQLLLINQLIPNVAVPVVKKFTTHLADFTLKALSKEPYLALGVAGQLYSICNKEELQQQPFITLYSEVLDYIRNDKKPIRKQVSRLLNHFFTQRQLEMDQSYFNKLKDYLIKSIQQNSDASQYAITLLSQLHKSLPYSILADVLYIIIEQLNTLDSKYYPFVFLSIENLLEQKDLGGAQAEKLLVELLQLTPEDLHAQHSYMQCLRQCLLNLNAKEPQQAGVYLPSTLSILVEFLLVDNSKIQQHARTEIINILPVGISTLKLKNDLAMDIMSIELDSPSTLQQKYLTMLNYLLSNRFDHANILEIYQAFFATLNESIFPQIKDFIVEFVQQKNRWPHQQFERTFGALTQVIPMSQLLTLFPLRLDNVDPLAVDFDEKSNAWILYILSRYAKPNFNDFLDYLFPIMQILQLLNQTETAEQKLMLNISTHLIEIAGNCQLTQFNERQGTLVKQFLEIILQNIQPNKPFFGTLLIMIAKLYSQIVSKCKQYLAPYAQQYISVFAKLVLAQSQHSQLCLNGIKVVAFAAPQQYLLKKFQVNMDKMMQNKDKLDANMILNMDIVLQVVSALEFDSQLWNYCINFCKTMIGVQSIQKKVYKFLAVMMKKMHYTYLQEAQELLLESECAQHARQKRFQAILSLLENKFSQENKSVEEFEQFIQVFLPEIVIADNNSKTRLLIQKVLFFIGNKLLQLKCLDKFISMFLAGLASDSHVMKAGVINTIAILINEFYNHLTTYFIEEVTKIIMMLEKEDNNEINKAIQNYVKAVVRHKGQIKDNNNNNNNNKMKNSKKKESKLQEMKIRETLLNKKNKQNNNNNNNNNNKQKEFKDFYSDFSDDEDDKPMIKKQQTKKSDMEMETEQQNNNVLLKYDNQNEQFHFEEPRRKAQQQQLEQKQQKQLVEYKDGKILVNEEKQVLGQKRRRQDIEEEGDDQKQQQKKLKDNFKKSKDSVHIIRESGQLYQNRRSGGGGDVLVKGRPEPFAFIQLNPKALNKRYKSKANKAFNSVLSTGGLKGIKSHK